MLIEGSFLILYQSSAAGALLPAEIRLSAGFFNGLATTMVCRRASGNIVGFWGGFLV